MYLCVCNLYIYIYICKGIPTAPGSNMTPDVRIRILTSHSKGIWNCAFRDTAGSFKHPKKTWDVLQCVWLNHLLPTIVPWSSLTVFELLGKSWNHKSAGCISPPWCQLLSTFHKFWILKIAGKHLNKQRRGPEALSSWRVSLSDNPNIVSFTICRYIFRKFMLSRMNTWQHMTI